MTAAVRRAFAEFWSINVGHVGVLIIFVFGLGVTWRNVSANQDADRLASVSRDEMIVRSVDAAVRERNLKLEAIAERLAREEALDADRTAQGREVAELRAQMKALADQILALREDLRSYQIAKR